MGSKSIVTNYTNISILSGEPSECRHHLVFGYGQRDKAEEDGLWIPLTHKEHNMANLRSEQIHDNPRAEDLSKIAGQLAFEKEYYRRQLWEDGQDPAREVFRERYGESYA